MTRQPISTDRLEAVKRCFEAYGADPAKWPAEARADYDALADVDEVVQFRADAEALDGFLGAATAPRTDPDLKTRLMTDYDAAQLGQGATLWGKLEALMLQLTAPRFASVGVIASAAALGIFTGFLTDSDFGAPSPEAEAYAYLMDAAPALYGDGEEVQWVVD